MPTDPKSRPRLIDRIRERIFADLGNECAASDEECDGPLEIDHPFGRDWKPRETGSYNRWLRYRREHEQGLIRLLCKFHNNTIRPRPTAAPASLSPDPF